MAVGLDQRIEDDFAAIFGGNIVKIEKHWRLYDQPVTHIGKGVDRHRHRVQHIGGAQNMGGVHHPAAISAFKALAQNSRLAMFKLLVAAKPAGLPASALSKQLGILPSTLSGHLTLLHGVGLVRSRRDGREIIYTA